MSCVDEKKKVTEFPCIKVVKVDEEYITTNDSLSIRGVHYCQRVVISGKSCFRLIKSHNIKERISLEKDTCDEDTSDNIPIKVYVGRKTRPEKKKKIYGLRDFSKQYITRTDCGFR